jgi:hypothetical protein
LLLRTGRSIKLIETSSDRLSFGRIEVGTTGKEAKGVDSPPSLPTPRDIR